MAQECYIWFDDTVKSERTGKTVPTYDFTTMNKPVEDQSLHWFHYRYGSMLLYKLWKVDDENYIAENMHRCCHTCDSDWPAYEENPSLALTS